MQRHGRSSGERSEAPWPAWTYRWRLQRPARRCVVCVDIAGLLHHHSCAMAALSSFTTCVPILTVPGTCQAEDRGDVMQAAAAEAAQATASLRERQRAAIATPGRSTPAHTPRRTFGL